MTLEECLVDYASPEIRAAGEERVAGEVAKLPPGEKAEALVERLRRIRNTDERDLYE